MKKEKQYSRRRGALRLAVRAAVILFLVNHFLLVGLLFPIQALRHSEERMGTGRTAVVLRDWAPEMHWSHLIYLSENENVTMLSGAYLTYLGWMDAFGVPLDCTEEAPIHGGWWSMSREDRPSLFYVFGRIDEPDIDYLEIHVEPKEQVPLKNSWQPGGFSWGISRDDSPDNWFEKDRRSYFLFRKSPMNWSDYPAGVNIRAIGYDKDHNEIVRVELEQGASSSLG